jgi:hypothetical protein
MQLRYVRFENARVARRLKRVVLRGRADIQYVSGPLKASEIAGKRLAGARHRYRASP